MNFEVINQNTNTSISIETQEYEKGILSAEVKMQLDQLGVPETFSVRWKLPIIDCYSVWSPMGALCTLGPDWNMRTTRSRLASGMPLHTILSLKGTNQITIALSDAVTPTAIRSGVCEEDACLTCCVDFFTVPVAPIKEYSATIRVDLRNIPYYDCIYDTVSWWEKSCGYAPAAVPEHARLPMNSLWYSYHQMLEVEDILKECRLSKEIGMDTVIVDDGWQTDDNNRGYAFCGDWEVAHKKIPDMKDFVRRIHDTGMKIMLWYSVPFVGCNSKNFDRFRDMLLAETGDNTTYWSLDPRYKEVRDFLISTYTTAVSEWKLDGLKLDFIDSFVLKGKSLEYDARRDYQSLEDAVDRLMTDITLALQELNPNILIEFRQSYIGPAIRKYGNILRVADCPNDVIPNRKCSVDLRLTSGQTAVHSDMLMWNYEDTVESAALQLASILYAVPQISVKIAKLSDNHRKMLTYYLRFWREHRDVLLDGKLIGKNPEGCYSQVYATKDNQTIYTIHTDRIIPNRPGEQIIAVNASGYDELLFNGYKGHTYEVVNCMGETVVTGVFKDNLNMVTVPLAGMVFVNENTGN